MPRAAVTLDSFFTAAFRNIIGKGPSSAFEDLDAEAIEFFRACDIGVREAALVAKFPEVAGIAVGLARESGRTLPYMPDIPTDFVVLGVMIAFLLERLHLLTAAERMPCALVLVADWLDRTIGYEDLSEFAKCEIATIVSELTCAQAAINDDDNDDVAMYAHNKALVKYHHDVSLSDDEMAAFMIKYNIASDDEMAKIRVEYCLDSDDEVAAFLAEYEPLFPWTAV
jgi:hypothetical protein